jgi:SAM-dependent methyltransferase
MSTTNAEIDMTRKLLHRIPEWVKKPASLLIGSLRVISYRGDERWCPVCEKSFRSFRTYGTPRRDDAQCVFCGALERHRLVWRFFTKMTTLFDETPKRMLHIAPERCFESKLRRYLGQGYITGDLFDSRAMLKMDITNINFPDGYFDVIYCSHVLEHVQDDKKAIREFFRVLKEHGWAILIVPITAERTFEDPTIVDPSERKRVFGQEDHVRNYGADYLDRLRGAGFQVKVYSALDLFENHDRVRMGLTPASGEIYYCTKS